MRQRRQSQITRCLVKAEIWMNVKAVVASEETVWRIHAALASPGRTAGKMQPCDVLVDIELDVVVFFRRGIDQVPEAEDIVGQSWLAVHRDNRAVTALQQLVIGREHSYFDKDRSAAHEIDLP